MIPIEPELGKKTTVASENPIDVYMKHLGDAGILDDVSLAAFDKTEKDNKKKAFRAVHQELLAVRQRSDSPLVALAELTARRKEGADIDERDVEIAVLILKSFNRDIEKVIIKQGRRLLRELPVAMKTEREVAEVVMRPYLSKSARKRIWGPSQQ